MTILEKENELFQRWRSHSNADDTTFFVQDGVLEADEYINSNIKICSILKEVPFDDTANRGYNFGEGFLKKLKEQGQEVFLKKKGTLSVLAKRISLIREIFEENYNKFLSNDVDEIYIENYKKSLRVSGSTKKYAKHMKELGGSWKRHMKVWLFCGSSRQKIIDYCNVHSIPLVSLD